MRSEPHLTEETELPEPGRVWLRRLLITTGVVIIVVVVILMIRHLIISKTTYRAWLIGTAKNCLVRVDTLSGHLTNISCFGGFDGNSASLPWQFQSGITDNKNSYYYASYLQAVDGEQRVSIGKFDIQQGKLWASIVLPTQILNFTQIQINPMTNHTRLVGVVLFRNDAGNLSQGIGVFEWSEEYSFRIVADWGQHPHPTLGACCQEGPHQICFSQGGLQPVGDHDVYSFPQCKRVYEWDTRTGNETTAGFPYTINLVNYSAKLDALLAIAMMPIPARPGRRQADVAVIENNEITQGNVLIHNLEYIRVPLETSLDDEKSRLYVLLGVPSKDGHSATQLRVYAVDVSVPGAFRLVTVSDFAPEVVYPTSISNIWYQKDYDD